MHERLVIGEVNDPSLADNDARRREQPVRLAHLDLGAEGGAGDQAEDDDDGQNAHLN